MVPVPFLLALCAFLLASCGVIAVAPFVWANEPACDEEKAFSADAERGAD